MHHILEEYAKGNMLIEEMLPYYEEHFGDKIISPFVLKIAEDFSKDFYYTYFESGKNYLENFTGFGKMKVLEVEYEFNETVDDKFIFTGKVDLIVEDEDGEFTIIDHKSKSGFKSKKELAEYATQLYLYAFAVERKYGKFPTRLMFNMFRKEEMIKIDFKQSDYEVAMQWLKDSVCKIEECFEFLPILGTFFCNNFCSYREQCEEKDGD
jgi:CRISPR/Cas system-associated exonuclease Cas4 (RecB family)